jgi:hypothetical protein
LGLFFWSELKWLSNNRTRMPHKIASHKKARKVVTPIKLVSTTLRGGHRPTRQSHESN